MRTRNTHPGLMPSNDALLNWESWKVFQIMAPFVEGFEPSAEEREIRLDL